MGKYENINTEYGIRKMIEDTKAKIVESQKEYKEVCEGNRYNPLCAEGWKKQIQSDIKYDENHILDLEESLNIKLNNIKGE